MTPTSAYIVARSGADGRAIASAWWRRCEREGRAFVRVTPRRTWATVELDMATTGRALTSDAAALVEALMSDHLRRAPRRQRPWAISGRRSAVISAVHLDDADALASELAAIADYDSLPGVAEVIAALAWGDE